MSGPFIYVGAYGIREGKVDEARKRLHELVDLVERKEPRLIAFNIYADDAGKTVGVVQVHPDAASMETHMNVIAAHLAGAFEYLDRTQGEHIFGTPSDSLAAMLRSYADPEAPATFLPVHEAGFTRAAAAR